MCTLTLNKNKNKLLLTVNRDELRARNEEGIRHQTQNGIETIYPVDARFKGTWVAVNNYGLVTCLLNNYQAEYNKGLLSRGLIIPNVIQNKTLAEAKYWLEEDLQSHLFNPFVLILTDRRNTFRFSWDGKQLENEKLQFEEWCIESSSSIDFDTTIAFRKEKFEFWRQNSEHNNILDFHLQQEPERPEHSVCVSRPSTHTKSITQIEVCDKSIQLNYLAPKKLAALVNTKWQAEKELESFKIKHNSQMLA